MSATAQDHDSAPRGDRLTDADVARCEVVGCCAERAKFFNTRFCRTHEAQYIISDEYTAARRAEPEQKTQAELAFAARVAR